MIEVIISHGLSVRMKIMIIFQLLTKFPLSQQKCDLSKHNMCNSYFISY